MEPGVITGSEGISSYCSKHGHMFNAEVKYLFTYTDDGGNQKLYTLFSWPESYESAVASIKYNTKLDIPFKFLSGDTVAEDEEGWKVLSTKVKAGLDKGKTAVIVTVVRKTS